MLFTSKTYPWGPSKKNIGGGVIYTEHPLLSGDLDITPTPKKYTFIQTSDTAYTVWFGKLSDCPFFNSVFLFVIGVGMDKNIYGLPSSMGLISNIIV